MSGAILIFFAAFALSVCAACSGTVNSDVQEVADCITSIIEDRNKDNGRDLAYTQIMKIQEYFKSETKLTEADAETLVNAMTDFVANDPIPENGKENMIKNFTGRTLGEFSRLVAGIYLEGGAGVEPGPTPASKQE